MTLETEHSDDDIYRADAREALHVVGVGASAGGLAALEILVESLPTEIDVAYVIIQHLSPKFESQMAKLLSAKTTMPVVQATNNQALTANRIYVIPPGKEMIVSDRKLLLTDRGADDALILPIDHFLRSLAADVGRMSIAVILTGLGKDGSRGVASINESGGLVIAQTIESAAHPSMPKSAVATGAVHVVLPPDAIGDAIARYVVDALSPSHLSQQDFGNETDTELEQVLSLLHKTYQLDFTQYKPATINRRVDRRMRLAKQTNLTDYINLLQSDDKELTRLYRDLLIGVTRFFRDEDAFEVLRREVVAPLIRRHDKESNIRVWTPGCASGEEAYSLAMLFQEEMRLQKKKIGVKIFATDAYSKSLKKAGKGAYSAESLESVPDDLRQRYFEQRNGSDKYFVTPPIRQMIVFAAHDLLKDPPFTSMDIVVCRNLLIYFQPVAQRKCMSLFHFALVSQGALFLGPSESVGAIEDEFDAVDRSWRIFRKRRDIRLASAMRQSQPATVIPSFSFEENDEAASVISTLSPPPEISRVGEIDVAEAQILFQNRLLQRFMPPGYLIDSEFRLLRTFGGAERFLKVPQGRRSDLLADMLPEEISGFLSSAFKRALVERKHISFSGIQLKNHQKSVRITAEPVSYVADDTRLIVTISPEVTLGESAGVNEADDSVGEVSTASIRHVATLESELQATRENLNATVEELETSNEELQAANEELLASNEEMQSTNEELQSVNEELHSLNVEHQRKINELTEVTSDLESLFKSTDVGVLFLDDDLHIRRTTPLISRVFKILRRDLGRNIERFSHSLKDIDFLGRLTEVLDTGVVFESEVHDLVGRPWLLRILPYATTNESRIEGLVVTLVDIATIKRQEQELQQYADIVENSEEAIIVKSTDGVITHWNRGATRMYGYTPEEAIGKHVSMIVAAEQMDQLQEIFATVLSGQSISLNTLRLTRSGSRLNVRLTVSPVFDSNGNVISISAVGHDYTQLAIAESELKIFKRAFDACRLGIVICDAAVEDLPISYANGGFLELTGFDRNEVVGRNCRFLQGAETDRSDTDKIRNAIRNGTDCRVSLLNYRKDGSPFWNELSIAPVHDSGGKLTHFVGVQYDITSQVNFETELAQAKQQAEDANEAKTVFLSNISHDIRTPLTTIIGVAELLKEESQNDEQRSQLEMIIGSGQHLSELIGGVLEMSKIESGTLGITKKPCAPAKIISDVLSVMQNEANTKGIALIADLRNHGPHEINSDPVRLKQIVFNLVGNAIKFTDSGQVKVELKFCDDPGTSAAEEGAASESTDSIKSKTMSIEVSDTGRGMSRQQLINAFKPFVQVDDELNFSNSVGTGLGLTICRNLAKLLGGNLSAESEVGKGSTFQLTLPAEHLSAQSTDRSGQETANVPPKVRSQDDLGEDVLLKGLKVWAADDERGIRFIIQRLLQSAGAKARMFEDGRDLIATLKSQRFVDGKDSSVPTGRDALLAKELPDLIVVDMQMKHVGGPETARQLRAMDISTPIVALTANAFDDDRDTCLAAGCDGYLTKPIDVDAFLSLARRLTSGKSRNENP